MTYQVLARKYRPRSFAEMAGQEHVLRALSNALNQGRLHHAYLFTGTRGVGKTTLARIIAKCLNCETGITATPCEQCSCCQEINQGRFVDLIEVDAASRTKVEDTRELLDNVQYAPTRGRYKIYLIDEVHMLSGHSFNALLKTLEEPPPHVIFLLATTDPQRLPVTVLSRCLQFNLKALPIEQIQSHLEKILTQEKIPFEITALLPLAIGAQGSLRDALSLLDQAIAYGGGQLTTTEVKAMLGMIEQTHILQLITAVIARNAQAIFTTIAQLAELATDFGTALEDVLTLLHRIAVLQALPNYAFDTLEHSEKIRELAQQLSPEEVQLYYQIALIGRRDLPLAPSARSGFEMVMLRLLAFQLEEQTPITVTERSHTPIVSSTTPVTTTPARSTPVAPTIAQPPPPPIDNSDLSWTEMVSHLKLTGLTQAFAQNCTLKERTATHIHLLLDPNQAALHNGKQEARLAEALSQYLGKPITVQISTGTSQLATPARIKQNNDAAQLQIFSETLTKDENIQAILQVFDATIRPGSIQVKETPLPESEK